MGRLTRKALRQPKREINRPPTTGPAATDKVTMADHSATMRARTASSAYVWTRRLSELGMKRAAPTPWTRRAPTSDAVSQASPQATEARVKIASPDK